MLGAEKAVKIFRKSIEFLYKVSIYVVDFTVISPLNERSG